MTTIRNFFKKDIPPMTAKKAATLERQPLSKTKVFDKAIQDLARKASLVLSYRRLAETVLPVQSLAQTLLALDIKPFSNDSVQAYKTSKLVPGYNWRTVVLSAYAFPIPVHVLNKAIQIKEADPLINLSVDYLTVAQRHPDPFLVATKDTETFYVEAWDEKDFESQLY